MRAPMVIKLGRHGQFLACSNYPSAKIQRNFLRKNRRNRRGRRRVDSGSARSAAPHGRQTGRFGKFLACSNYPNARTPKNPGERRGKLEVAQEEATSEVCEKCGAPWSSKPAASENPRLFKLPEMQNNPENRGCRRGQRGKAKAEPTGETAINAEPPSSTAKGVSPFIACSNYPKCQFTKKISAAKETEGPSKAGSPRTNPARPKSRRRKKTPDDRPGSAMKKRPVS